MQLGWTIPTFFWKVILFFPQDALVIPSQRNTKSIVASFGFVITFLTEREEEAKIQKNYKAEFMPFK